MDLSELQKYLDEIRDEQNNRPIPEFEGYSPDEMHQLLHFTFDPNSPLKLRKLSDDDYLKIPILKQIKYLTDLIGKQGELKLTQKGYLPTKFVADLYKQGFIKEKFIESGLHKLYKETDSMSINLTRILVEMTGLVKKRHGKLSLTIASQKLLSNYPELFKLIFITFATRFNWAYYDGYGDNNIGQLGYGYSLVLLSKYGNQKQSDTFYAEKYFMAFPQLLDSMDLPSESPVDRALARCYSLRTFERFLDYFGLITIEKEDKPIEGRSFITKTDLFDRLIGCTPPKNKDKTIK